MQTEPLMTIDEVSVFLNVTPTSVRRWTNSGQLRCYRVGNRNERRFEKKDIMDYLKQRVTK